MSPSTTDRPLPTSPGDPPSEARGPAIAEIRAAYLEALHDGRARSSRRPLQEALDAGLDARLLVLDVITPALRDVGAAWEHNEITVAHEHVATAIVLDDLRYLGPFLRGAPDGIAGGEPGPASSGRVAIVASSEDELHSVGARILADFLDAAGWDVLYAGAATPGDGLARLVHERRPDVVALSTTLTEHLGKAAATIARLKAMAEPALILVGGAAYDGLDDVAARQGADLYGRDPAEAIELLRERFPSTEPTEPTELTT